MKNLEKKIAIVTISIIVAISLYNIIEHGRSFFDFSIGSAISLIVTIIFLVCISNALKREDQKKEVIIRLLEKIQVTISDGRFYKISNEVDIKYIEIQKRTLSNQITCLDSIKTKEISVQVDVIKEKFNRYEELFDSHFQNLKHMQESENELMNWIKIIDDKCNESFVELYK